MTSEVPKWLSFFKEAGIPPSLASNYAIAFCDNRIQSDMLPDLTKEILRDMGVTVMGDIIAILRHAKQVHAQSEKEKAVKALEIMEEQEIQSGISTPKKSTAASRMVDHWINNQRMSSGNKSPVPGTESPTSRFLKKKMTIQTKKGSRSPASNTESPSHSSPKKRLTIHASTTEYEPAAKKGNTSLSERFSVEVTPQVTSTTKKKVVPKVQRISVQLPNDTKKLGIKQKQATLAKQKQGVSPAAAKAKTAKKTSVFDRLGDELDTPSTPEIHMVSSTTSSTTKQKTQPTLKPLKTSIAASKNTSKGNTSATPTQELPKSVFSRLGGMAPTSPAQPKVTIQPVLPSKRPQVITVSDITDEDDIEEEIDYTTHSVLRPPPKKQTVKVKPVKTVKPVKRTVGVVSHMSDVSTSKSVFSRLGPK